MKDPDLSRLTDQALYSEIGRRRSAKRKRRAPGAGRPAVAHSCELCGAEFGARALRLHMPACRATEREKRAQQSARARVTPKIVRDLKLSRMALRGLAYLSPEQLHRLSGLLLKKETETK